MSKGKKRVELKFFDPKTVQATMAQYQQDPAYREKVDALADSLSDKIRAQALLIATQLLLHGGAVLIEGTIKDQPLMTILDPAKTYVHFIDEIVPARSPRRKLRLLKLAKKEDPT